MRRLKRWGSMFLAVCMTCTILQTSQVNAFASGELQKLSEEAYEETDEKETVKGLNLSGWINWDADVPQLDSAAVLSKEDTGTIQNGVYQFVWIADDGEKRVVSYNELTMEYYQEAQWVPMEGMLEPLEANTELVSVTFPQVGTYRIYIGESADDETNVVTVQVSYPEIGIYTRNEMAADALVNWREYGKEDGDRVFYMLANLSDNTISDVTFSVTRENGSNTEKYEDYFTAEKITTEGDVWKLTIADDCQENFRIDVNAVFAPQEGETYDTWCGMWVNFGGTRTYTGLVVKEDLIWNDEGIDLAEGAEWKKEIWSIPLGTTLYVSTLDEKQEETRVETKDIQLAYLQNDGEWVTEDIGNVRANSEDNRYAFITFNQVGDYKIYLKETDGSDAVIIHVDYPETGFYTENKMSVEKATDEHKYGVENGDRIVYMLANVPDHTISDVKFQIEYENGDKSEEYGDYFTAEKLAGEGEVWKLTIADDCQENFGIKVSALITAKDNASWETDGFVWLEFGGTRTYTGLVVKDWIIWNDENIKPAEEAQWQKESWTSLDGSTLYISVLDEEQKETKVLADALQLAYLQDGNVWITENVGAVTENKTDSRFVDIAFKRVGDYKIYLKETDGSDAVTIHVDYPQIGFYTSCEKTADKYVTQYAYRASGAVGEGEKEDCFYMIPYPGEDNVLSDIIIEGTIEYWNEKTEQSETMVVDLLEDNNYVKCELLENGVYKFTVKSDCDDAIGIHAQAKVTAKNNSDDCWDTDNWIYIYKSEEGSSPTVMPTTTVTPLPTVMPTTTVTPLPTVIPTATPRLTPTPVPKKKGTKFTDASGITWKVTKTGKNAEVAYMKPQKNLKATVKIPEKIVADGVTYKVTSIAANAFKGNKKIKKVVISSNITTIGNNAFKGCKKLSTIIIQSKKLKAAKVGNSTFKGIKKTATIQVPADKLKAYKKWLNKKGTPAKVKIKGIK